MSDTNYSKLYGFDYHTETLEYVNKLLANKLPELAIKPLSELAKVFPGSFDAHLLLAKAYSDNNEIEKSITSFKRLFELNPQHIIGHVEFAKTLIKSSRERMGLEYFAKVTEYFPDVEELNYYYSKLAFLSNEIDLAFTKIKKVLEINQENSEYYLLLSKIGMKLNNNDLTLEAFQNGLNKITQETAHVFVEIAELLFELGDSRTALGLIEQNLNRFMVTDEYLTRVSDLLVKNNLINEAKNLLEGLVSNFGGKQCRRTLSLLLNNQPEAIKPKKANRVVFVCSVPRARESKFGWALRKRGWEVVLLLKDLPDFEVNLFFDEVHKYNNAEHALMLAEKANPSVVHVFHTFADDTSIAFTKEKIRPTIFDTNDIFEGTINEIFSVIPAQRYGIENADGLCCRDLQIAHACNTLGYKRNKTLFMQDYCWNDSEIFNADINNKKWNEEISVAAVGNFPIEKKTGKIGFLKISEIFANQGIHFHIYPHWFFSKIPNEEFEDNFSEYLELQARNPYFKIKKPIPMNDLVKDISSYDFGIGSTAEILLGVTPERSPAHFHFGGSGRNVDYLDALLPTISTKNTYLQFRRLRQYGLAIEGNPHFMQNAKAILSEYKNDKVIEQLIKARNQEAVMNHVDRLIEFYNSF